MVEHLFRKTTFLALLLLLGAVSLARADQAFAIPTSDKVIKGVLTLPDGFKAQFVVRDGTWVTVEDTISPNRYFYAFDGIVDAPGKTNFRVYEIKRSYLSNMSINDKVTEQTDPPLPRHGQPVQRDIHVGRYVLFPSAQGIKLSVKGIEEGIFTTPPISDPSRIPASELEKIYGAGASGNGACCVSCGGRSVCATEVSTSCGACSGGGGGLYQ